MKNLFIKLKFYATFITAFHLQKRTTNHMRIILSITAILFLFLTSCEKESYKLLSGEGIKTLKNGSNWESDQCWANYLKSSEEFVISGSKRDAKYHQDEILQLRVKKSDAFKSVIIRDFSANLKFIIGGDGIYDQYLTDIRANNGIHITKLDTVNKIISGYFNVFLKRDPRYKSTKSIHFTRGIFSISYLETE